MTKVLCVLLLALTVASARTLSGQRAVYNYQPKTNSVRLSQAEVLAAFAKLLTAHV